MTEIPAHLLARAQEARAKSQPEPTPQTVEVPVPMLEHLREHYGDWENAPSIQALIALIPEPTYEPDLWLIQDYARAQDCSNAAARDELIRLHNAGLIVSFTDQSERK